MEKNIIIIALFFCWSVVLQAQSTRGGEFTLSVGAGSSSIHYQLDEVQSKSKSGIGWGAGVGYSYYFSKMMGVSLGLEVESLIGSSTIGVYFHEQQITNPPGFEDRFLLRANYNGLKEKQTALLLQIPLMFRFQFPISEKYSFYLGTGVKAALPVACKWDQNIESLTTSGYSEHTFQNYINMPEHGFSTYENINPSGQLKLKSPVWLLAIEAGMKWRMSEGKFLYTGVFVDYGLSDMYAFSDPVAPLQYNYDSPENYHYNSILTTSHYNKSKGLKPFIYGVKISLGLGGSEKNKEQQTTPLFRKNQYKEVISQYQQAAYQGIAEDQTQLGLCYKNGWGVSKDPVQAVYWLRKAADHGHALAQVHLGTCYKDGIGVPENIHQAIFWYKKAADQDNAEAKKLLKQLKVTFP